jgi:hypothetical protein
MVLNLPETALAQTSLSLHRPIETTLKLHMGGSFLLVAAALVAGFVLR